MSDVARDVTGDVGGDAASDAASDLAAFSRHVGGDVRAALGLSGAGSFGLTALMGDASTRRYYRATGGGRSAIVMRLPADAFKSDEGGAAVAVSELPFVNVQRFLAAGGVAVPEIYVDATGRGYLLLEDLGDTTFYDAVKSGRHDVEGLYGEAFELLGRFKGRHGAVVGSGCVAAERAFEPSLLRWELDHFTEWGVEADTGARYDEGDRAVVEAAFDAMVGELAALPKVLTHRDYQSRNLMVRGGDVKDLVVIDFQDALMGAAVYDLVALLRDSYIALDAATLDRLLSRAHRVLRGAPGIDASEKAFRRAFHVQTLQRKLKDSGRFVFIDRVRKNPWFLQFIPDSLGYVRQAFEALREDGGGDDYGRLREVLARYRAELRA